MRRMTFPVLPAAAVLVLGLTLAGCSSDAGASDSSVVGSESGSAGSTEMEQAQDPSLAVPFAADGSAAASGTDPAAVDAARQIVTTGDATITAKDPLAAGVEAARIVESAGGRIDGRTEEAPTDGNAGRATLQLRIPADSLTTTLESLKDLGDVVSVNMSSSDVTTASVDLDARITALSASVDRLLGLLTTATDTSTLIDLETAISGRQGELESLQAQRRLLSDQVAMSSVNLNLVSVADAPRDEPDNFWDALLAGLASFAAFFAGLLLVLGFLIPWIAVVAIGVLVALFVARRRKKRAASHEASRAASSSAVSSSTVSSPSAAPAEEAPPAE